MSIRRSAERRTWTTIDNRTIEDSRLSFGALGMLTYILSKPDNWTIRTADMLKRGGIKRPTYVKWLAELEAAGYASLERTQGERGRFAGTTWVVTESPSDRDSLSPNLGQSSPIVMTDVVVMTETATKTIASPRSAQPKTKGAPRAPRPLFDAFKASFPTAPDSVAGRFNKECDRLGYTVDQWRAFMTDRHTQGQVSGGFITRNNALDRFSQWCKDHVSRDPRAVAAPPDAPPDWRELVYTHDGTRRAPALILPRIGLDRFTPAAAWPAWLRELEGIAV